MKRPVLIAQKSRFQRISRRIGLVRGFVMFNLMWLGLGLAILLIGWSWGDSQLVMKYVDQFFTWMTEGITAWKWLIGVIINIANLIPIFYWVNNWNLRFDNTPDAIYYNGNNFELIKEGKKDDLYSLPSIKRGRFYVSKQWLSLSIERSIDPYILAEMIDSHKTWLDVEKAIMKHNRTS